MKTTILILAASLFLLLSIFIREFYLVKDSKNGYIYKSTVESDLTFKEEKEKIVSYKPEETYYRKTIYGITYTKEFFKKPKKDTVLLSNIFYTKH